jgi:hypothetical protein
LSKKANEWTQFTYQLNINHRCFSAPRQQTAPRQNIFYYAYSDHPVVRVFLERGWHWGCNFEQPKDYHHFEKP